MRRKGGLLPRTTPAPAAARPGGLLPGDRHGRGSRAGGVLLRELDGGAGPRGSPEHLHARWFGGQTQCTGFTNSLTPINIKKYVKKCIMKST